MNKSIPLLLLFVIISFSCSKDDDAVPAPTITNIDRTLSVPGKELLITGTNFSTVLSNNVVTINGSPSTIIAATSTEITTIVPTGTRSGNIVITVNGVSVTGPEFIIYTPGTVTSISPICGPIGTSVKISGTGFETVPGNTFVAFKGAGNLLVKATVASATSTELNVTVPDGSETGNIVILAFGTENLEVQSPLSLFSIVPFTLTGFSPAMIVSGSNTNVTITGSGFSLTKENNTVLFTGFDGTAISTLQAEIISATSTQLVVSVPSNALTGPISVKVNDSNFVKFNSDFKVTF